jgi:endoribonuclease Dicer
VGKERLKSEHKLGEKTVADVAEAMIGAAYITGLRLKDKDNAVCAVTRLVGSGEHAVETWEEYYEMYRIPSFQLAGPSAAVLDLAQQIEEKDNYHFSHPTLLRSAFSHPSYPVIYDKIPSYQRLEFLGDSLFDMACVNWLFHEFPNRDPQWLTEHKVSADNGSRIGS